MFTDKTTESNLLGYGWGELKVFQYVHQPGSSLTCAHFIQNDKDCEFHACIAFPCLITELEAGGMKTTKHFSFGFIAHETIKWTRSLMMFFIKLNFY